MAGRIRFSGTSTTGRRTLLTALGLPLLGLAGVGNAWSALAQASRATPDMVLADEADAVFIAAAFEQRRRAVEWGDQPFGAVVVRDNVVVGEGPSRVILNGDPTAHAEMEAVRDACRRLGTRDLAGCVLYATSQPCRMCSAASSWARIARVFYGSAGADSGPSSLSPC